MFCGRQTNARINHIHERALRAVYNDEVSSFDELLGIDKSETIHRRNSKILAAELFKSKMVFQMTSWLSSSVKETA